MRFPWRRLAAVMFVAALIAFRMYLPVLVRDYVERKLDSIPGYDAKIKDVDLYLIRGAYTIKGIKIEKANGKVKVPFFACPMVDLSIRWSAILHGALVGEMYFQDPQLNFVNSENPQRRQTEADSSWQQAVKDLFPLRIDHFEIDGGQVHFRDFESDPQVDVYLQEVHLVATNLTNSRKISRSLVAEVRGSARGQRSGDVNAELELDPLSEKMNFKFKGSLKGLNLVELNDLLRAYGNFDVEKGSFDLFTEIEAKENSLKGYVKPFMRDVSVFSWKNDAKGPISVVWEGFVSMLSGVLNDRPSDSIASRIPIEGSWEHPEPDVWRAIGSSLYHAFIRALYEGFDPGRKGLPNRK